MSRQKLITRRNYTPFIHELLISLQKNNLIRVTMLILVMSLVISILLTAFVAPLCASCRVSYPFSSYPLLIIHLIVAFPMAFMLHEFMHYAILDTDVKITFALSLVKIEPLNTVSSARMIGSALAGPLTPSLIGLIIYCIDSIQHLNLFGIYFPFLLHILILPFDILGVFGLEIE